MKKITKRHWISFLLIVLFNIASITFISGIGVPVLGILLCLCMIHFYLKEPFTEYGIHFRRIYMQLVSGLILAVIILVLYGDYMFISWKEIPAMIHNFIDQFPSSSFLILYLFSTLAYAAYEEVVFRGFLLSFFQKLLNGFWINIFINAFLFGISHYPLNHYIKQGFFSFITGIIYGYLRAKEPERYTLFTLSVAHFINNVCVDLFVYKLI